MLSKEIFFHRLKELGLRGTLRRVRERVVSSAEIEVRALWSALVARRELAEDEFLAHTTGEWSSISVLLDHFVRRKESSYLLDIDRSAASMQTLCQSYSEHVANVQSVADAACRHEFNLLGKVVRFPDGIDWHVDPLSGWQWPLKHIGKIERLIWSSNRPSDFMLTWALNRHQHFVALGMAYWITTEQKYCEVFADQMQSWLDANPDQHGVNWFDGLETALRLISWMLAFQLFRSNQIFQKKVGSRMLKCMLLHAQSLYRRIKDPQDAVPNNHLIGECSALLLFAALFPEFRQAELWRETSRNRLIEQVAAQTYVDGANKEQATAYHRFVTEFLLLTVAISHRGLLPRMLRLEDNLVRMLEYTFHIQTPLGTAPMWGDSGYVHAWRVDWGRNYWNFQHLLDVGAVLFERGDWKYMRQEPCPDLSWIFGHGGQIAWDQIVAQRPPEQSHTFTHSGMSILRRTWDENGDVAFFRSGPFGLGGEGECAHAHCDLLSIILWVAGRPVLVDSGTYSYHGLHRDAYRRTAAHNTVRIDVQEQAQIQNEFSWVKVPEAELLTWSDQSVSGRMKASNSIDFTRELTNRVAGAWIVRDFFSGDGEHELEWFFHFHPSIEVRLSSSLGEVLALQDGKEFILIRFSGDEVELEIRQGWFAPQFRVCKRNRVLYARWKGVLEEAEKEFIWEFVHCEPL
jgi:hypothetical protein